MGETEGIVLACGGICAAIAAIVIAPRVLPKRFKQTANDAAEKEATGSGDADTKQKWPEGRLTIYFGSQTGTAESYAQIVAAEGSGLGFLTNVVDLDDFSEKELQAGGKAIFIMATYGRGNSTDNAYPFFTWLENNEGVLPAEHLALLQFTVFGLGNTQYEHYNLVGRTVQKNLGKLGAQQMCAYGEGDDDHELEEDFEAWKEGLWMTLVKTFSAAGGKDGVEKAAHVPISVKMLTQEEAATLVPTDEAEAASSSRFYWQGRDAAVVVNRELRAEVPGVGSTRHVEINLEGTGISYHTADNLAVLPLNDEAVAERLCKLLGYDPDSFFTLVHDDGHKPVFPTPCTVRQAFSRYMDIMSIPRRNLLEQLTPYVVDETEREGMHLLSSKEGREEYHREVEEPGWTLAHLVLERFPSLSISLDHFLHIIPHLHPRYYTISSSSSVSPSRVHVTVALLEQERTQGRVYRGICSSFLSNREPHSSTNGGIADKGSNGDGPGPQQCRVFVRESTFRLPQDATIPILMIGPGTGVAPMRALLQERAWQKAQGVSVGRNVLYFGCRSREEDYIYKDELEAYEADGTLDSLRLAFSREGASKVYVQHLLRDDSAVVWDLLKEGAYVYVCGGTHMGTDVDVELSRVAQDRGSMGLEESKDFIKKLHDAGRYVQELWS